ncbi:cation-translocating P-type ATPase [Natronococcus sp. JC468]|uniref:cation-translocating P-type ATPase n=1 Tax=Natronococcus sp. JC468 TaxID=1961921 RepID=UPI00143BF670|nr:cation-translocating P-type ATPase [Natronococcus sp. JC468]NKE35342.1 cation-translocating P-type ATPase [Natronococcus sp. JC468]
MAERPHELPADRVVAALESQPTGLTSEQARRRRAEHGENEIAGSGGRSPVEIGIAQFDSVLIWVLLAAAVLSVWAGNAVDAILIAIIVVANGIFGFVQDYRAERSLESLRELAAPTAAVRRDGEIREIDAIAVVPGDVVVLRGGDVVPADGRLLEATDLEVDEAALTGESAPVSKSSDPVESGTPIAERTSMVYKGTNVTRGKGVAVVTETGMKTKVGEIARELAATEETRTPLQDELDDLGRTLGIGVLVLSAFVAPLLLLRGTDAVQAALTAVSLAVAAVPEGLPAVVTLALALGVRQLAEENALVRRLPAIEALGAVDVVCTDKTGTLTRGEMTVSRLWVNGTAVGLDSRDADANVHSDRERLLLRIGALCNDATLEDGGDDPTERALLEAADRRGVDVDELRAENPRTDEVPFSSERKWMGTVHGDVGYVKGAPEVVLSNCERILTARGPKPLTDERRERVETTIREFGDDALRVLAGAYREGPADANDLADELTFVGLAGMIDPPREEVADAIAETGRAGIDVKMVTGDNVRTTRAIAESLGIGTRVLEGSESVTRPRKRRAMTGDGVNDAPALKNADVGVAMGIRGTDVARQASDIVLLDDNYATIERAVERGRGIFDNIWKFVAYLLSANVAEVAIVFLASLYGYLILPAVQLLWINLLTDGLPALALGADPESGDVMERPPRDPDRGIVGRQMLGLIGGMGTVTTVVLLALMYYTLEGAAAVTPYTMTMVFTGFVFLEFAGLYVIRWLRGTPTVSNPWLTAAVAASAALQLAVLYTPLNRYFGTVPLGLADWGLVGVVLAAGLPAYVAVAALVKRFDR